jgi:sortase A
LRPGDRVSFHRGSRRYLYVVTGSAIVSPHDVTVMAPTRTATLTMISCTPFMVETQRIVVTAALV